MKDIQQILESILGADLAPDGELIELNFQWKPTMHSNANVLGMIERINNTLKLIPARTKIEELIPVVKGLFDYKVGDKFLDCGNAHLLQTDVDRIIGSLKGLLTKTQYAGSKDFWDEYDTFKKAADILI